MALLLSRRRKRPSNSLTLARQTSWELAVASPLLRRRDAASMKQRTLSWQSIEQCDRTFAGPVHTDEYPGFLLVPSRGWTEFFAAGTMYFEPGGVFFGARQAELAHLMPAQSSQLSFLRLA